MRTTGSVYDSSEFAVLYTIRISTSALTPTYWSIVGTLTGIRKLQAMKERDVLRGLCTLNDS